MLNVISFHFSVLNEPDKVTGVTPIMAAVQSEHTASIEEPIARRVKLANKDNIKGNTVFHHIVRDWFEDTTFEAKAKVKARYVLHRHDLFR